MTGGSLLDYGCGNGVHSSYFADFGYTPYGCDVSETAIRQCQELLPEYTDQFHIVDCAPDLAKLFAAKFDVVLSNQVLYFVDNTTLDHLVPQFFKLLKPGGIIFATFMATTNYFSRHAVASEDGMSEVTVTGRINATTFVNFKTREQILDLFGQYGFEKLHLGAYSSTIREDEGPSDHHIYVGRK